MSENFVYEAPCFSETITSENETPEKVEAYFDFDRENPNYMNNHVEDFYYTEEHDYECNLRKSLSMSCLPTQPKYAVKEDLSNGIQNMQLSQSIKSSTESMNKGVKNSRMRSKYGGSTGSNLNLNKQKYVSMAEEINKFQFKTPTRFHSQPKSVPFEHTKYGGPIPATIPKSPALATRRRHRETTVISTEQREQMEYDEAQRNKFKANPINSKVLQGDVLVKVERKSNTEFAPFKLTEPTKKALPSPAKDERKFHAKPVPHSVYEPMKPIFKPSLQIESITPKFMKKYYEKNKKVATKVETTDKDVQQKSFKPLRTVPMPFSFEKRMQDVKKKKEDLIKKMLDDEKKAREFHAKPLPKTVLMSPKVKPKTLRRQSSQESIRSNLSNKSDDAINATTEFKARPAKVLQMKPFVPKKPDRELLEISEFQLNTDRRAKEREEYQAKLAEINDERERHRQIREEELYLQEQEEIARLRKELQHVAQPIRIYKKIEAIPPKPVTQPITPKFVSRMHNKENVNNLA